MFFKTTIIKIISQHQESLELLADSQHELQSLINLLSDIHFSLLENTSAIEHIDLAILTAVIHDLSGLLNK